MAEIETIRALSWKAPYAQLMLRNKVETRTWKTDYRGLVLICCSKIPYTAPAILRISGENQFNRINRLYPTCLNYSSQLGHAIAIGRLVDCRPMLPEDQDATFVNYREPWTDKRLSVKNIVKMKEKRLWCHFYKDVRPITPFPFIGSQSWRNLTKQELSQLQKSIDSFNDSFGQIQLL